MKTKNVFAFFVTLSLCLAAAFLHAQPPQLLNYQGQLVMDGTPVSGTFSMTFSIYEDSTAGRALWSEIQTVTSSDGIFNVLLGSKIPFPSTLFTTTGDRYLGIRVGAEPEMRPRFRLTGVAYAFRAAEADGVADGAVTTADLADGAISSSKIADNAVSSAKIAAGQVVKSINSLKDDVTLAEGKNVKLTRSGNTITVESTAGGVPSINGITGPVTIAGAGGTTVTSRGDTIIVNSVIGGGGTGIQGVQNTNNTLEVINPNGPIATINVKNGGITDLQLADETVTVEKLAAGAVTGAKIADGSITNADIAATAAIAESKLALNFPTHSNLNDPIADEKAALAGTAGTPSSTNRYVTNNDPRNTNARRPNGAAGGDLTGTYPNPAIAANKVVKSINGIKDAVALAAGANVKITPDSVTNTITIEATGGGGIGIQGVQNTDGTLDIINPNGPVATINVKNGGIGNLQLANGAVTSAKIADGAITNADIATNAAIAESKLALNFPTHSNANDPTAGEKAGLAGTSGTPSSTNRYVTDSDPRNTNARPPTGAAGGDLTGTYPNPTIAANAVTGSEIADLSVNTGDLADNAVTAGKIQPNIVSSLAGVVSDGGNIDLVEGANITITPNDAANTITIAATGGGGGTITGVTAGSGLTGGGTSGSVTLDVGAGTGISVSADAIALNTTFTDGQYVNVGEANSISSSMIQDGTITGSDIAAGAVEGVHIVDGEVESIDISDGAIEDIDVSPAAAIAGTKIDPFFGSQNIITLGAAGIGTSEPTATLDVNGDAIINGNLSKGSGSFRIDHPLDPANKYLYHSFVESPDMMNIYNGNVVLDNNGEAVIALPEWFEALNKDFRYQLTCIGGFAPVYIAEEITHNRFKIAGGTPGLKVSWQVTGIRHDPYAEKHRIPVEQEKRGIARGRYLHPEAYGQPPEKSIASVRNP